MAIKALDNKAIDLVILDIYMPVLDGIEVLKRIRQTGKDVDIILITAAQEGNTVKEVVRYGAFDYIIKPFKYERFREALVAYQKHYKAINSVKNGFSQMDIDNMFKQRREESRLRLPKGIQQKTLELVINILNRSNKSLSADEMAHMADISRVTARRYLEYLVSCNKAYIQPYYKDVGRPINKYRLLNTR
jgi:two-component system response regulator DctR